MSAAEAREAGRIIEDDGEGLKIVEFLDQPGARSEPNEKKGTDMALSAIWVVRRRRTAKVRPITLEILAKARGSGNYRRGVSTAARRWPPVPTAPLRHATGTQLADARAPVGRGDRRPSTARFPEPSCSAPATTAVMWLAACRPSSTATVI